MRIFVAGATGAIGRRLVPMLVRAGHHVTAMTRSPGKADWIRTAGAVPAVADALDPLSVLQSVRQAAPEVVVHELTALPSGLDLRQVEREFAATNLLRTRGTDNLLAAAREAGCRRIVAQSFAGWPFARAGGPVKSEEDPLDPNPPAAMRATLDAIRHLEQTVTGATELDGAVLRYGAFYGPGNTIGEGGAVLEQVRKRRIPVVGGGTGIWSFLHIDDAARATVAAIQQGGRGIYNIVDDEPAPVSAWLPALAESLGASPPFRIPACLARLVIGEYGVILMTQARGASNAKAKRDLAWSPVWSSWREGFRRGLAA